ncbi:putative porin [Rhabdobacter roseus]|uniref:Porin n=1 Tax=Rhabdobacter roseus TaxID=1655419 RepID=A0A840TKV3_9BACT|nr:putative porin [Rhabdobacter roseus]MBB5283565.1 hypothetical protein [Rhabdobacter roseus]
MKNTKYGALFFLGILYVLNVAVVQAQQLPGGIRMPSGVPGGLGGGGNMGGAVLDDSTKTIYGPQTTLHFYEEDILNNRDSLRFRVDTLLDNFHRWTYLDRALNRLVDLGNLGTATRPVFYQGRDEVGAQLGFRAYDPYAIQPEEVKYHDTRSPYTDMTYIAGGRGQNILRFGFNQNVNPRLNVGFRLQRFTSNKQYGTYSSLGSESNLAQNWNFLLHTNYFSANKKYTLLAHFRHLNHQVKEQGGLIPDSTAAGGLDLFNYEGPARLDDQARSWERRNVYHLYHQYRLANGFQLFQTLDYRRVINRYTDPSPLQGVTNGIYPGILFDSTSATYQQVDYKLLENRIGIKGTFSGFTYRAYMRNRLYSMQGTYNLTDSVQGRYRTSHFEKVILGLWLSYYLKDSTQHLTAEGEHLIGRDFRLKGELATRWFRAGYHTSFWSPDLLMERYVSNHVRWENNFTLTGANTLYGSIPIKVRHLELEPTLQYQLITRYLYYDTLGLPRQLNGSFSVLRLGGTFSWSQNKWNAFAMGYYTVSSNSDVLRIPALFANAQISYDFTYAKVLFIRAGVAVHYRSAYLADAYLPLTQQFHIQNDFRVDQYAVADVFATFRIKRVRVFLKMSHVNEGLLGPGYYTTPGYLGLRRTFGFGLSWPLFD